MTRSSFRTYGTAHGQDAASSDAPWQFGLQVGVNMDGGKVRRVEMLNQASCLVPVQVNERSLNWDETTNRQLVKMVVADKLDWVRMGL